MKQIFCAIAVVFALVLPVWGQDQDDGTRLERWIQDSLSGAGRTVRITGFSGALSSQAQLQQMTIADEDGVWLTLTNAQLDWSRAALLQGRLELDALTAEQLDIVRKPVAQGVTAADSEATPFQLPDLPVSVEIGQFSINSVTLGSGVLGQEVALDIQGDAVLSNGSGTAVLRVQRIDGTRGEFQLQTAFENEDSTLSLDVTLVEDTGGLVSSMLNLPGQPALEMSLRGEGALSDFQAELALATPKGQAIQGQFHTNLSDTASREFSATVKGDFSHFFSEDYQPFFGSSSILSLNARSDPDGAFELQQFQLSTRVMQLAGEARLDPSGLPRYFNVFGTVQDEDAVLLPFGETETRVTSAALSAQFDAAQSDRWTADVELVGLDRADVAIDQATLRGGGQIQLAQPYSVTGRVEKALQGIALTDPALSVAVGPFLSGRSNWQWSQGAPLEVTEIDISGETVSLTGTARLEQSELFADVALDVPRLWPFAELANQPLRGELRGQLRGQYAPLSGAFDVQLASQTQDLAIGQDLLDPMIAGIAQLNIDIARDETGTTLRGLDIASDQLLANVTGQLDSAAAVFNMQADVADLAVLPFGMRGDASMNAQANWDATTNTVFNTVSLDAAGNNFTATGALDLSDAVPIYTGSGTLNAPDISVFSTLANRNLRGAIASDFAGKLVTDLTDANAEIAMTGQNLSIGVPSIDPLLAGASTMRFDGAWDGNTLDLRAFDVTTPQLSVSASGDLEEQLDVSGTLRNLGLYVPEIPGAASLSGQLRDTGQSIDVDLSVSGPANVTAGVKGSIAKSAETADLTMRGQAPLALANSFIAPRSASGMMQFDLTLDGALGIESVSGGFTTEGARVAVPDIQTSIQNITASGQIAAGRVDLDVGGRIATGGRLRLLGPLRLSPSPSADLELRLFNVVLQDPALYETEIDGTLTISGALPGGQIAGTLSLDGAEVQVPSSGLSSTGDIPEGLVHVAETAPSRETRARAGLLGSADVAGSAAPFGLDIDIDAPNRIFVRGRGLDAELGGALNVGGTTENVVPSGQFELERGRFDLLGQRLTLSEGIVTMRGSLDPYLRLVAETETTDYTVRAILEGTISDPSITFESSPELPEDEVLSQLIFGRSLDTLSPFQAAQLAASVATLAGRNEGLVSRLRSNLGLDDLDITSDEDGETSLRAGKYISDNVYTDVTVGSGGDTSINLNLDILPNVTATGGASTGGEANLGLFWQRDY